MSMTTLEIAGGIVVIAGVIYYFINKSKTTTKPVVSAGGTVTTIVVPPGFVLGANNVLLQPVTIGQAFAACMAASAILTAGTYQNGLTWNQAEYLREMTATAFANWCAGITQIPAAVGTDSVGWVTGLSNQGMGFFLTLTTQGLTIPATDPRSSTLNSASISTQSSKTV